MEKVTNIKKFLKKINISKELGKDRMTKLLLTNMKENI
jgi:hypothetical protein